MHPSQSVMKWKAWKDVTNLEYYAQVESKRLLY